MAARYTPEDLMNEVIRADAARRKARGAPSGHFTPFQRIWIEPFFNVIGLLWGKLMFLLPWRLRKVYVQWVVRKMGGHAPEYNPHLKARIHETIQVANGVKKKSGEWPALLLITSHGETEGPLQWVRFEVMAQGLELADAFIEAKNPGCFYYSHPRCVLAIDPFALDTVSSIVAGFYGAWMHQIYFAYDRQPSTQSWIQRHFLLRGSSFARAGWKLLSLLRSDVPVIMAFGGGLPHNARLLYAAREFVQRCKPKRWTVPKRAAQIELLRILASSEDGTWPAETGLLSSSIKKKITDAMQGWGLTPEECVRGLSLFEAEFKRSVPYRERLWRVLMARLVRRGKPVILLPISHESTAPHIKMASPILLEPESQDFSLISGKLANIF